MAILQARGWEHLEDGAVLLEERSFDYVAGEIETVHTLAPADGPRHGVTYRLRVYTATELVRMLDGGRFLGGRVLR